MVEYEHERDEQTRGGHHAQRRSWPRLRPSQRQVEKRKCKQGHQQLSREVQLQEQQLLRQVLAPLQRKPSPYQAQEMILNDFQPLIVRAVLNEGGGSGEVCKWRIKNQIRPSMFGNFWMFRLGILIIMGPLLGFLLS